MRKCVETNRIIVYGCLSHSHRLCYSTTILYNTCTLCVVKSTRPIVDQIYVENYPEMYIISYTRYKYL